MSYSIFNNDIVRDLEFRTKLTDAYNKNHLYVKAISGPLKGTFGKFKEVSSPWYHDRAIWKSYLSDPSFVDKFIRVSNHRYDDKFILDCNLPDGEDVKIQAGSCNWVLSKEEDLKKIHLGKDIGATIPKNIPLLYDALGSEIKIGKTCSYLAFGHRTGGAQIYYGIVSRITHKGEVFCTDFHIGPYDPKGETGEKKLRDLSCITILDEDVYDRLTIARLST